MFILLNCKFCRTQKKVEKSLIKKKKLFPLINALKTGIVVPKWNFSGQTNLPYVHESDCYISIYVVLDCSIIIQYIVGDNGHVLLHFYAGFAAIEDDRSV